MAFFTKWESVFSTPSDIIVSFSYFIITLPESFPVFVWNNYNIYMAITINIINNVWTLLDHQGLTPCMYSNEGVHLPMNLEYMLINLLSYI